MESNVFESVVCDKCKKRVKNYRDCAKCHLHICHKCGTDRCPICERGTLLDPQLILPQ